MTKRLGQKGKSRFWQRDLPLWLFWLGCGLVVGLRLVLALAQRVFLMPNSSSLDDMLMVRGAINIVNGQWLGAYGAFAMAKNMGFSLWLAFLHVCHVPYLVGNVLLWLAACAFAVRALRPLAQGNAVRLCLFAVFAFFPYSYAGFTMRAYRDAIFQSFCLLAFAGVLGLGLRLAQKRLRGSLLCGAGCGAGLAGAWLLREDGAVVLVYVACAAALVLLYILLHRDVTKRLGKVLAGIVLPAGMLVAGILGFSAANYAHFGLFMVNDLNQGSFPVAYGALAAVSQAESGYTPMVPVSRQALEKLYREVPALARLQPWLDSNAVHAGYAAPGGSDEYGGSFYYALRLAAHLAGQLRDGPAAQALWKDIAEEVALAVREGRLQSATPGVGVVPRWNAALFVPAMAETGGGLLKALTFTGLEIWPQESMGELERAYEVADFLHDRIQYGTYEGTDIPYFSLWRRVALHAGEAVVWLWRVAVWPLLALALWRCADWLARGAKAAKKLKTFPPALLQGLLVTGLLLAFLLRVAVAAYMDAAAFGLGPQPMYLSGGMPALLLFLAWGALPRGTQGPCAKPTDEDSKTCKH